MKDPASRSRLTPQEQEIDKKAYDRPRLTEQERVSHRRAHDLLRDMLVAAGLTQRDLESQLSMIGFEVGYRQIENYGKPIPRQPEKTNRAFPPDWPLLAGIVQVLLIKARKQRPTSAQVVGFLRLLSFPYDEISKLRIALDKAGLIPRDIDELDHEIARQFPEFGGEWDIASDEQVDRSRSRLQRLGEIDVQKKPGQLSLPEVSYLPLEAMPLFVGREQILTQLVQLVHMAHLPLKVALVGPAGVGKSRLAAEFALRVGQYFLGGVFWIRSPDAITLHTQVIESGRMLRPNFDSLAPNIQLRIVRRYWENALPKLIIFDNCEDEALLRSWLPRGGSAYVILTSRRVSWSPALGVHVVPVARLPRPDSLALLKALSPEHAGKHVELDQIAAAVADMPHMLQFVGERVYELGPTHVLGMLTSVDAAVPIEEQTQVDHMFDLMYAELEAEKRVPVVVEQLIARLACFAPDFPVSNAMLASTLEEPVEPAILWRSIQRLIDKGAAERWQETIWMPPTIAAQVGRRSVDSAVRQSVERALLDRVTAANTSIALRDLRSLQPHLLYITEAASRRASALAAPLAFEVGRLFYHIGAYDETIRWYERAIALRRQHDGPEHPEIVRVQRAIASVWLDQGRYADARELLGSILAADQRVYGPCHFRVAWDWNLIGETLREERRDLDQARSCYERACAIFDALEEPMPLFAAMVRNNLGALLHIQGDFSGARASYMRALDIYTALNQRDHSEALKTQHNLGEALADEGKWSEAYKILNDLLERSDLVRGPGHPDTVITQVVLARCLRQLRRWDEARALLSAVLQIRRSVFGDDSPLVAEVLNALAQLDPGE